MAKTDEKQTKTASTTAASSRPPSDRKDKVEDCVDFKATTNCISDNVMAFHERNNSQPSNRKK